MVISPATDAFDESRTHEKLSEGAYQGVVWKLSHRKRAINSRWNGASTVKSRCTRCKDGMAFGADIIIHQTFVETLFKVLALQESGELSGKSILLVHGN